MRMGMGRASIASCSAAMVARVRFAYPTHHRQRHPPDRLAVDQQPHRLRTFLQRQPVRDVGPDLSRLRPRQQRLQPHFAQRRISPHRFAGADAEHAGALDQQQIGAGEPDAAGETDHQQPRAPGDAAHAVLEHLAADGIEHHVGAAPVGDALDGVAERFAAIEHQMIGAPRLRHREFLFATRPPRSRWRRASCPSRPRQGRRRRRRRAPAALRLIEPCRDRSARDRRCRGRPERSRPRRSRRSVAAASVATP